MYMINRESAYHNATEENVYMYSYLNSVGTGAMSLNRVSGSWGTGKSLDHSIVSRYISVLSYMIPDAVVMGHYGDYGRTDKTKECLRFLVCYHIGVGKEFEQCRLANIRYP